MCLAFGVFLDYFTCWYEVLFVLFGKSDAPPEFSLDYNNNSQQFIVYNHVCVIVLLAVSATHIPWPVIEMLNDGARNTKCKSHSGQQSH